MPILRQCRCLRGGIVPEATMSGVRRFRIARDFVRLVAVVILASRAVSAQTLTGPFENMTGWWLHPTQGTLGVTTDGVTISIDRDGDGTAESDYPVPTINTEPLAALNLRLTPTREILFAFGDSCGSAGTMVYFYTVPAPPAALSMVDSACIEYGIGQVGFYDTGICVFNGVGLDCAGRLGSSPLRRAYVADQGNFFTNLVQIHWFDLNAGTHRTTFPGFNRSMPLTMHPVSPYGDVALVQHGISSTSDYTLVDLCAAPRLGDPLSSNVGGELFGLSGMPTVEMVDLGGGDYVVRVTHPELIGGGDDFAFTPCGGSPPLESGACCQADAACVLETSPDCEAAGGNWLGPLTDCASCPEPNGACCVVTGCAPDVDQGACALIGGTWNGPGSSCTGCPPPLRLSIAKTAPAAIGEGTLLTYTLSYENVGGQVANSVSIQDTVPSGTTFVSASDGGVLRSGRVEWQLGTLGLGESGTVTFTVRVSCGQSAIVNDNYRIIAGFQPFGGLSVSTTVTAASSAPVDTVIESAPVRNPLRRNDLVEHAITLTNTVNEARTGVNFRVDWGFASDFEAMIDDAGGAVQFSGTSSMTWTGDVGALASSTIRFSTRVRECTIWPEERLNRGNDVSVRNACGAVVGTGVPPVAVPIEVPTAASWQVVGRGPAQSMFGRLFQVARVGTTQDLQLVLSNRIEIDQFVSTVHVIPVTMIPQGDPPFVPPTDPNTLYDAGFQTISWSGVIPAHTDVFITFRVLVPSNACRTDVHLAAGTGVCANDLDLDATLLLIPPPRTDAHMLHLRPFAGIIDAMPPRTLMCINPEIFFGMGAGANGDIFVAGVPSIYFNPGTLAFDILDEDYESTFSRSVLGTASSPLVHDAAVDPRDGTALFVGYDHSAPPRQGAIGRYDPVSGQASPLVVREDLYGVRKIVVGQDGVIATIGSHDGVVQIDPAAPNSLRVLSDAAVPFPSCIAQDSNDDYIVANWGPPKVLAHVDRVTGAYTILVPDLDVLLPIPAPLDSAAVGDGGEIYLVSESSGGMVVQLGPPAAAQPFGFGSTSDIEFVSAPEVCPNDDADGDGDGDVDLVDHVRFTTCLVGPEGERSSECLCYDLDQDADVDLRDWAGLQTLFAP